MTKTILNANRIVTRLSQLKEQKRKALVLFVTAGYPALDSTVPLVLKLAEAGADIIELGMPFSDPLADGPIIQTSSQQAIKNGISLHKVLSYVKEIRTQSDIPLALMGYLNPILQYGETRFFTDAQAAGVDGVILPEVPLEESERFVHLSQKHQLAAILFVSPTTPRDRIQYIDKVSTGFLYCVSMAGVTGRTNIGNIESYLKRVKQSAKKNPVLVGFGIKTHDDAHRISRFSDGVIVGSALVQKLEEGDSLKNICDWVRQLKEAMRDI